MTTLASVRWAAADRAHLTLAFLGERPGSVIDAISGALSGPLSTFPLFHARLSGGGLFTRKSRSGVGWAGLSPAGPLRELAAAVRAGLQDAKIPYDEKPFAPHVTLFRAAAGKGLSPRAVRSFLDATSAFESSAFAVDRVTLVRSESLRGHVIHSPMRVWPLKGDGAV